MPTMIADAQTTQPRPAARKVPTSRPVSAPLVEVAAADVAAAEVSAPAPQVDQRLEQARRLADQARAAAATAFPFSSDRAEWLGVQAAAEQVLRPEVTAVDGIDWLVRLHPEFIAAFVRTSAMLASTWSWPRARRAVAAA